MYTASLLLCKYNALFMHFISLNNKIFRTNECLEIVFFNHFTLFLFLQIIVDDDLTKEWILYEAGPKSVKCPLICFPPASGTADVYFRQILGLSALGYRVIGVSFCLNWLKLVNIILCFF